MTEFFRRPTGFRMWRLAIWKVCNGALTAIIGAYIASTAAVNIEDLSTNEKLIILLGCWLAGAKVVDAFLDQTITDIKAKHESTPVNPLPPQ